MDVIAALRKNRFVVVGRVGMDLFTHAGIATQDSESFTADMGDLRQTSPQVWSNWEGKRPS